MIKVSKNLFIGAVFLIISFFFNTAIVSAGSAYANTIVYVGSGGGGGGGGVGDGDCRDGIQNGGETGIDTGGRCGTGTGSCPTGTAGTPPNCTCTNPADGDKNCNVPDLSGNLTALSGSCTIPAGENSCPIAFTWTTTGQFFSTSDVRIDGGVSFASGNYSWLSPGHYLDVPYGHQVFALFHGTIRLDREYVSATCASAGTWNGSTCGGTLVCQMPCRPSLRHHR